MTPTPEQPDRRPILGFVAETPILTADGPKRIEDIKPGDMMQVQPGDDQGDDHGGDELRWVGEELTAPVFTSALAATHSQASSWVQSKPRIGRAVGICRRHGLHVVVDNAR